MIRIGTSGWSYDHWREVLYSRGTPSSARLSRYVEVFDTVELNASYYRWPRDTAFAGWRSQLPGGFTMSVKAHRGLTHFRRLRSPEPWIERFEQCWSVLDGSAEALLVQPHPALERDDALLDEFLTLMPDHIPVAMELRHASWNDPEVYALLRRHAAAYVVMSGPGLLCEPVATSELVYIRLHGPSHESIYAGAYSGDELRRWAEQILRWHRDGHRVVVYFNNDLGGHAVRNARTLKELVAHE